MPIKISLSVPAMHHISHSHTEGRTSDSEPAASDMVPCLPVGLLLGTHEFFLDPLTYSDPVRACARSCTLLSGTGVRTMGVGILSRMKLEYVAL